MIFTRRFGALAARRTFPDMTEVVERDPNVPVDETERERDRDRAAEETAA